MSDFWLAFIKSRPFPVRKWLPPHSADPLPEVRFRDCGFVVSGTGFQNVRLRSVGISILPAPELRDFQISRFGALGFQYVQLRSVEINNFQSKSKNCNPEGGRGRGEA